MNEKLNLLRAPFLPSELEVRPGGASGNKRQAFYYLDTRAVQKRLDTVFPGSWSIPEADFRVDTFDGGNIVYVCKLKLDIITPDQVLSFVNVGEKTAKVDNQGNLKIETLATSAYAQAFKRAASLAGVGVYLYHIPPKFFPYQNYKWLEDPTPKDQDIINALRQAGFVSKCQVCSTVLDWKSAAKSVDVYGKLLCQNCVGEKG